MANSKNLLYDLLGWVNLDGSKSIKGVNPGFIFTIIIVFAVTRFVFRSRVGKRNSLLPLPPGPRGVPLFGNLLSLDPELHSYFATLAETYGPIFKLKLGGKLGIVINSSEIAREVLKDQDITFANRDVPASARAATYGGADIVWTQYGPEWRMLRKVCVLKMLSSTTLNSLYELRRREVGQILKFMYSHAGSPVHVGEQLFLTFLNVTTNMLWGASVEGDDRESVGAEFRKAISDLTYCLGQPNLSDFFPWLARFDLQGIEKKTRVIAQRFDRIFEKMIGQRLQIGSAAHGWEERKDFLQYLLKLKEEGDSKTPLTMTRIKALLMDMVIGASDTSSNTSEFAMAEMMNNPEIMRTVQEELESVVGKDNMVEESHISKLKYLQAVIKETLRLHTTVPLLVPHCPSEDCTVANYSIPKGSRVFLNAWAIHRDAFNWENPLKFDPSRFLDTKWDYSGNDFKYFPFGSGRRICAGIPLAERMINFSIATLIHTFDWRLPEGEKLDLSEQFGIVLKKKIPLVAIPTSRLSNSALYESYLH